MKRQAPTASARGIWWHVYIYTLALRPPCTTFEKSLLRRCSDPRFSIDSAVHHGDIALDCSELLKQPELNPLQLALRLRDESTSCACGYWVMRVRSSPTTNDCANRLIPSATKFFENNAMIEVSVIIAFTNFWTGLGRCVRSTPAVELNA